MVDPAVLGHRPGGASATATASAPRPPGPGQRLIEQLQQQRRDLDRDRRQALMAEHSTRAAGAEDAAVLPTG